MDENLIQTHKINVLSIYSFQIRIFVIIIKIHEWVTWVKMHHLLYLISNSIFLANLKTVWIEVNFNNISIAILSRLIVTLSNILLIK